MNSLKVVDALGALANEHRLAIYRLLVETGPEGLPAGAIGERVGLVPSSLTFHLQALQRAHLVRQVRASRQLIYSADYAAMNELVGYLTDNCCAGSNKSCDSGMHAGPGAETCEAQECRMSVAQPTATGISHRPPLESAVAMLADAHLPTEDLTEAHCDHFFFAGPASRPTGLVGLELLGDVALLRSLVVTAEKRGQGEGTALLDHAERYARDPRRAPALPAHHHRRSVFLQSMDIYGPRVMRHPQPYARHASSQASARQARAFMVRQL